MSTVQETPQAAPNEFSSEKVTENAATAPSTFETKPEEKQVETKTEGKESETKVDEAEGKAAPEDGKSSEAELDLSLKQGSGLTDKDVQDVKEFAKTNGLTKEAAQMLLDSKAETISQIRAQDQEDLKNRAGLWLDQVKADKEIGGDNYNSTIQHAKIVLDQFATPSFKETLNTTGLGNHPEVIKIFAKIGKRLASDSLIEVPKSEAAQTQKLSDEEIMYGKN